MQYVMLIVIKYNIAILLYLVKFIIIIIICFVGVLIDTRRFDLATIDILFILN